MHSLYALPLIALIAAPLNAQAPKPLPVASDTVLVFPAAHFDAQSTNAFEMIERLPGFSFDKGDADVRGFAGASGNVLLDGIRPASKQDDLETILRRIPAASVERIELIRGGAHGIDMSGRAVVANVVRKREIALRGEIEAGSGFYSGGRTTPSLRVQGQRRDGDTLTEVSVFLYRTIDDEKGSGPRNRYTLDDTLLREATYDENNRETGGEANLSHERALAGGKLHANLAWKREHERADTAQDESAPDIVHERDIEIETVDTAELGMNWTGPIGPALSLDLFAIQRLSRDRSSESSHDEDESERIGTRSHGGESIGRAVLHWRPAPSWTIEGGGEVAYNLLDSHASLTENGAAVALPADDVRITEYRVEPFVTATWQASTNLLIEAGTKVELSRLRQTGDSQLAKRFLFPKPHALLAWTVSSKNQLRFEVERTVGQLDFKDFVSSASVTSGTITAGNADLEPDRRWSATASWERRFGNSAMLVLTAQQDWISHVSDRLYLVGPGYAFDAPGNIGRGHRTLLTADLTLPLDALGIPGGLIKADAGYHWTSVRDPMTGEQRRISKDKPLEGDVHFTQDIPGKPLRWGADIKLGETEFEYRFDELRRERVRTRVNLFAEYKPNPHWRIRMFADNVTSRHVTRQRILYDGPRGAFPVRYVERRDLAVKPYFGFLVTRTLGRD